jgi:cation diffusion facilitator CzcD-associated flavoprotein CzcO
LLLTHVPATKPPEYAIEDGVNLVPTHKIAEIKRPWNKYVVIGAGKTGIDAILHLLDNNVDPNKLTWIVPNDSWFFNRDAIAGDNIKTFTKRLPTIMGALLAADDVNDVYKKFEEVGYFMRLDKNIWPTKMRAATVSSKEMHQLQTIVNVVRLGRIERITNNTIIFKQGESIPTDVDTLHIDCSASGTNFPPVKEKLFEGKNISLQMVQVPQPCTTGAMIAALEIK